MSKLRGIWPFRICMFLFHHSVYQINLWRQSWIAFESWVLSKRSRLVTVNSLRTQVRVPFEYLSFESGSLENMTKLSNMKNTSDQSREKRVEDEKSPRRLRSKLKYDTEKVSAIRISPNHPNIWQKLSIRMMSELLESRIKSRLSDQFKIKM